ncbi:hypothetical protein AXK11_02270 [Cephaloticoccus primus]|uniref:TonB-dependent receptor n=1 Tax=Cephaloticoccus primus TaxID=1548207 RepID=A0A139SSJ3_9BACT|nr:TonB-dependent receptor [Cephaloticoccus primus]KXU37539.1 hypothetical protein AXK11_02270 [Cephaloticoccus primus]
MNNRFWLPKLAALSLALAPALSAQTQKAPVEEPQPTQLSPYVTVATRTPHSQRTLGTVVDVITPEEAQRRQLTSFGDVLGDIVGAPTVRTGAAGGINSIFLRGTNSNQTLFLVDGIRMSDSDTDYRNFLGGAAIGGGDTVEIARGPQSTLYGADAIGGVISLRAERGSAAQSKTRVGLEGGTFKSVGGYFHSQGESSGVAYNVSVRGSHTDNERENNSFDSINTSARIDVEVDPAINIGATVRWFQGDYESPGSRFAPTLDEESQEQNFLGTVFSEFRNGERLSSRVTLGAQSRRFVPETAGTADYVVKNRRLIADWQTLYLLCDDKLSVTAGVTAENLHTKNTSAWANINKHQDLLAFYINQEFHPTENIYLTGGLRHDDFDTFGEKTTGRASAAWLVANKQLKLRASYGTGFRAPSLIELYGVYGSYVGNPNLKPETSRGWDAGADFYLPEDRGVIGVTWFENRLRDLIATDYTPIPSTTYNVGRARTRGVEVKGDVKLAERTRGQLGYTYLEAKNQSADERLLRRPRHTVTADLGQDFGNGLSAGIGVRWIVDREDIDAQTFATFNAEDYTTLRIYVSYAVNEQLSLRLRVENALDESYEEAHGYPALGTGTFFGVDWKF